jgi:hypothetical protein
MKYNSAFFLCGCETWFLTLKEEDRLRVCPNLAIRNVYESKRQELIDFGEKFILRNFMIYACRSRSKD